MAKTILGTVHGKTIELTQELGVPDGQQVEITVRPTETHVSQPWGEELRRCAGALADISGLDEDMEEILGERKSTRFRNVTE
jgi:hypothetical protein